MSPPTASEDSTWRGWQLGAASYVTKPFDNESLISELIRVTRPMSSTGGEPLRDDWSAARAGREG